MYISSCSLPSVPLLSLVSTVGYMKKEGEGEKRLQHQKVEAKPIDSAAHHVRGFIESVEEEDSSGPSSVARKYRKGACENCGASSHRTKECVERPRKRGARWTGEDVRPDEILQEARLDFEGKRDRWAGYDAGEYEEVIREWEEIEAEKKALRAAERARRKEAGEPGHESHGLSDSDGSDHTDTTDSQDDDDDASSSGEEKYADAVDMPGQKVDLKTRMTVRNLRLREDTAKYLRDLNDTTTQYDPKTRSLRKIGPRSSSGRTDFVAASRSRTADKDKIFAWDEQKRTAATKAPSPPSEGDEFDCTIFQ